jgi:hypothetical protein
MSEVTKIEARGLPPGIDPVSLMQPKKTVPVLCGGCNQPYPAKSLIYFHGKRLCNNCFELEERSRKTESLLIVVKEILTRKIDAAGRVDGAAEGTIELNATRKAFLSEFGGETTFGTMWAQLLKHVHDRAMRDNKNVNVAAKMYMDAAKFLEAAKDREVAGFQKLTLEQMKEQQALALASYMRDTAVADAMQRMIELVEAAAMGGDDMDDLIVKFDRMLTTPIPQPKLTANMQPVVKP